MYPVFAGDLRVWLMFWSYGMTAIVVERHTGTVADLVDAGGGRFGIREAIL